MSDALSFMMAPDGEVQTLERPESPPWSESAGTDLDLLAAIGLDLDGRRMLAKAVAAAGRLNSVRWQWVRGKSSHAPLELTAWTRGPPESASGIEVRIAIGASERLGPVTIPADLATVDFQQAAVEAADRSGLGLAVMRNHEDTWRLDWLNVGGARLLGRPRETLLNGPPVPIDPSKMGDATRLPEEGYHHIVGWRRPDGRRVQLAVGIAEGHIRGDQCIVLFFRDVTERIEAERRAQHAMTELERTNQELSTYSAAIGHDLRAPLRNLNMALDLIQRTNMDLRPDIQQLLQTTTGQVKRMDAMLLGLLECTQTRTATATEVIDIEAVLNDLMQDLREALDSAGAKVIVEELPLVQAERSRLERVLSNLIVNAVKYRGETPLRLRITGTVDNGMACIGVHDNGRGFRPEQAETLFGLFRRGEGEDIDGYGVGLALCRRIVEAHGGRIWADGAPGQGATFWFTLPVPLSTVTPATAEPRAAS